MKRIMVIRPQANPLKPIQIDRFIVDDIVDGLRGCGKDVSILDLGDPKDIQKRIKDFSPEIILICNDVEGEVLDLIEEQDALKVYWITHAIESFDYLKGRSSIVFCVEMESIEKLKAIGIMAHYLPFGVNPKVFKPLEVIEGLKCDISFVGASYGGYISWWLKRSIENPILRKGMERIFNLRVMGHKDEILSILKGIEKRLCVSFHLDEPIHRRVFLDRLRCGAIGLYRYRIISAIRDLGPHLYGDPGWMEYEELKGLYKGWLHPRKETPLIYNASKINLNICMSATGSNLRLFEVPSCCGFLITNRIDGLEDLYRLDEEIVSYRDTDELREKILYYLDHDDERCRIAKRGYQRTLREHTFLHRMEKMLSVIEDG